MILINQIAVIIFIFLLALHGIHSTLLNFVQVAEVDHFLLETAEENYGAYHTEHSKKIINAIKTPCIAKGWNYPNLKKTGDAEEAEAHAENAGSLLSEYFLVDGGGQGEVATLAPVREGDPDEIRPLIPDGERHRKWQNNLQKKHEAIDIFERVVIQRQRPRKPQARANTAHGANPHDQIRIIDVLLPVLRVIADSECWHVYRQESHWPQRYELPRLQVLENRGETLIFFGGCLLILYWLNITIIELLVLGILRLLLVSFFFVRSLLNQHNTQNDHDGPYQWHESETGR